MRYADAQLGCSWVQYLYWRFCSNFLTKTILCLEDCPVGTFLQRKIEVCLSTLVGGESLLLNNLAQFPGIDIGGIRGRNEFWGETSVTHGHHIKPVVIEFCPFHTLWLIECVNL